VSYINLVKKEFKPHIGTIYGDLTEKKDPHRLPYNGSQIYHGRQRNGKTLSMIKHSRKLKSRFPRVLVVANIWLAYLEPVEVKTRSELDEIMQSEDFQTGKWQESKYMRYRTYDQLIMMLRHARGAGKDGSWGVHFMIDEIHQFFHSHDSKSMPVWVATIFSQQGKQFILVTGTVQVWENVIKALREQIQHLILCKKILGWIITQVVIDPEDFETEYGETTAPVKKKGFFFMTQELRESYNTLELIDSGREIFGGNDTKINIKYDPNGQNAGKGKSRR